MEAMKPLELLPEGISTNIIYFKHYIEPILTLIQKSELRDLDVIECKKNINTLAYNEAKQEPLIPSGIKEGVELGDIQYYHIWTELKSFVRKYCKTQKHVDVMNCLLAVKSKDFSSIAVKNDLEKSLKELEKLSAKYLYNNTPHLKASTSSLVGKTILELWIERCEPKNLRPEFAGMCNTQPLPNGNFKFVLYKKFNHMKSFYKLKKD